MDNLKTLIDAAQAPGSIRLFSVRHEFPTEWAKFQGQAPSDNQRFGLTLNLRKEHYPFWSQGRLESVKRLDILARSSKPKDEIPPSLDVFDKADNTDKTKKGTLAKETAMDNLLVGKIADDHLPATPMEELKFFFDDKAIEELWIAITWSSA